MERLGISDIHAYTPSAALCMAQVERIVQSPDFDATDREGRFLRYVVEETLAGNAARIKAYSIAVAVFGRKESFDPQTDPIVRIEAGRLRRALERYYLTAGASDPLLITIPKGHYVPVFSQRDPILPSGTPDPARKPEPTVAPVGHLARRWPVIRITDLLGLVVVGLLLIQQFQILQPSATTPQLPRITIEQFEDLGRTETSSDIATGLTREVIAQLSRFKDIRVIESDGTSDTDSKSAPRYVLHGSINLTPVGFRLSTRMVQQSDGIVLWTGTYEGDLTVAPLPEVQTDIANKVAIQLGQTYGAIFLADKEYRHMLPPDDWEAYECIQSFHAFRATLHQAMIPDVQRCLERTVARFPDYSTAWAMLSLVRLDWIRSEFPHNPATFKETLERAFSDAQRAITLDPQNVRALQAEMNTLFWDRQYSLGKAVGDRALALNPNDTELLADYGYRLALSGAWHRGCAMIEKAQQQDLVTTRYYNPGLALCAYFAGNLTDAVTHIRKATPTSHPLDLLVAMVIHGETGNLVEADRLRRLLDRIYPALLQNVRQEIALRLGRPEDVERILGSLTKASVPIVSVEEAQESPGN